MVFVETRDRGASFEIHRSNYSLSSGSKLFTPGTRTCFCNACVVVAVAVGVAVVVVVIDVVAAAAAISAGWLVRWWRKMVARRRR